MNLLAFAYIPGVRHADYSPGSADLPIVVQVINRLQPIRCPDLPVKRAEQRWAAYVDDHTDLALLYDEIARDDPQPWKKDFAAVAQDWAKYRSGKRSVRRAIVTW